MFFKLCDQNGITIHTVELFSYRIKDFSITHVRVFYYCKDDTMFEGLQIQFLDALQGFKDSKSLSLITGR